MRENFDKFRRKQIAELRPIDSLDIQSFKLDGGIIISTNKDNPLAVSISEEDKKAGSPKIGDMVARNPKNHLDQWLVARQYFEDNFEQV